MSSETAITTKGLVKTFGSTRALDGLDMTVKKGEVHGFLGPNGAGKSTTIRVLLGLMRKDSGEARVLGGDPWDDAVTLHKRLAYVPGEVNLWPNLTGGEAIDLLTRLRGNGIDKQRRSELLQRFELNPRKKIRTYSKGNRQKVAIIAALASDVELYLFDEPTSGLDPLLELVFQDEVKKLKNAGKTVLLSSHILAEVEALCDTITIIREGRAVESGSLKQLRHLTRTTIKVSTSKPLSGLKKLPGVQDLKINDDHAEFEVEPDDLNDTLKSLTAMGVEAITSHPPTLEELFMRHYGDDTVANEPEKAGRVL
jgi:ABC-2 type transport system ATP-binding protein